MTEYEIDGKIEYHGTAIGTYYCNDCKCLFRPEAIMLHLEAFHKKNGDRKHAWEQE